MAKDRHKDASQVRPRLANHTALQRRRRMVTMVATMDVLLVEDDPRIARVVERALTDVGHRVEVARDGLEGLTSAERGSHDLVVLDVMLPEMDGFEVARELRRQKMRTPILMLTARDAV